MADAIPLNVFLFAVHSYGFFFHTQWQNCFHHQPRNGKDVWTQPFSQLFLIVRLHGTQQAHSFKHAKTSVLLHTLPLDTEGSVSSCLISTLKQRPSDSWCWPDRKMCVTQLCLAFLRTCNSWGPTALLSTALKAQYTFNCLWIFFWTFVDFNVLYVTLIERVCRNLLFAMQYE